MNAKHDLQVLEEKLQFIMNREIVTLREILSNLHSEQHSLLIDDDNTIKTTLMKREPLIEGMQHWRIKMIREIKDIGELLHLELSDDENLSLEEWMSMIIDIIGNDNCEIHYLRDHILALVDKIDKQNHRNRFLMDLKHANRQPQLQTQTKPKKTTIITMERDVE